MTGLVVTGAAGWLGLNIIDFLAAKRYPHPVRTLARTPDEALAIHAAGLGLDVHVEVGDVSDANVLGRLFGEDEGLGVIHAAGVIHPSTIAEFERVNVEGTRAVIRQAQANSASRFVHISSNSPFGTNAGPDDHFRANEPYRPYLGYGQSKMRGELAVRESDIDAVILRPLWFYGPFQPERQATFFTMVRTGRFPLFRGGANRRSLTYVPELAEAAVMALGDDVPIGSAWWIADSRSYEVREIVDSVREALRLEGFEAKAKTMQLPALVSEAAHAADRVLQAAGRYNAQVHVLGELGQTIAADATAGRERFGLSPVSDIVGGMRASIAWCVARGMEF